jgi:hypothetical protein
MERQHKGASNNKTIRKLEATYKSSNKQITIRPKKNHLQVTLI